MTTSERVAIACQCGSTMTATLVGAVAALELVDVFWEYHRGQGHGGATFRQAANARRRAERARLREEARRG